MLVKLTNALPPYQDMPVHISVLHIVSVYEEITPGGGLVTMVYGREGKWWKVEEGLSTVVRLINEAYRTNVTVDIK